MRDLRAAFVAALLPAALAGCDGGEPKLTGPVLTAGALADVTGLDPSRASDGESLDVAHEVFDTLVRFAPGSFALAPGIAESWSRSADGKTWTFRLAPGLIFSDGTPLDAAAVKFNFERWGDTRNPAHGAFAYPGYAAAFGGFDARSAVAAVAAPDARTVVLRLRRPVPDLLHDLATAPLGIGSPAAIARGLAAFDRLPVASGPYLVVQWVPGDRVVLGRDPAWPGRAPAFANVIVRYVPDPGTGVLAMKKFDIDLLIAPSSAAAQALESQPGVRVYGSPAGGVAFAAKDSLDGVVASPDTSFHFETMKPKAGT